MNRNDDFLRLLSVFHYVVAAMAALASLFPLIHLGFGVAMLSGVFTDSHGDGPPRFVGWLLVAFASFLILAGLSLASCLALAGRSLARRRRYTFCLVIAAISCMFPPFGTVLGVFTLIVLLREGVRLQFEPASGSAPSFAPEIP
ncbi:MAG TPA: hypothetical protein PK413_20685 [Thermoanaerobaculia bacterium]|nr:hypothetical protein [Thermoanaerobaculia bacterium]